MYFKEDVGTGQRGGASLDVVTGYKGRDGMC